MSVAARLNYYRRISSTYLLPGKSQLTFWHDQPQENSGARIDQLGEYYMLSLFLLWPTGSTLGLVLAVLGIGIWMGVQHLNYLEFGELRRVAQRTLEQRLIFVNNM